VEEVVCFSLEKLNAEEKNKYARLEGELGECKTQMAAREKELAAMALHVSRPLFEKSPLLVSF
jgi:hypothetical protein